MTAHQYQLFGKLSPEEFGALEKDIVARGVMVPVEVDENGEILDGHHRVEIADKHGLKYKVIRRRFKTEGEKREHVYKLNLCRRQLDNIRWGLAFERLCEERGLRPGQGAQSKVTNEGSATMALPSAGTPTREELAEELGVPCDTMNKRVAAGRAYKALPAKHRKAVDKKEKTLNQARREVRREHIKEATIEESLGDADVYAVILADPPWSYANSGFTSSAAEHYPTMPVDEIAALLVEEHATTNAALFLWATNPLLPDALLVMQAWGFEYKTNFVWVKEGAPNPTGFYVAGCHELLLIGIRGSFPVQTDDLPPSVIKAPKRKHSQKPDEAYDIIEKLYPGMPYMEMFARQERQGWKSLGNEVDGQV